MIVVTVSGTSVVLIVVPRTAAQHAPVARLPQIRLPISALILKQKNEIAESLLTRTHLCDFAAILRYRAVSATLPLRRQRAEIRDREMGDDTPPGNPHSSTGS